VKARIGALAVGLAADCDSPERDVESLMSTNLPGAGTLPFAGFVTPDLKWVGGFSGYKDESGFLGVLEAAEKSPLLDATEAVKKKLATLADKATKAAEKGDWKTVMASGTEAAATTGRCPDRGRLEDLVKKARAWAEERLAGVVADVRKGGDLPAARKALEDVRKAFAGEAEAEDAAKGLKALQRIGNIRAVEADPKGLDPESIRKKAAKEYEGSRWAAAFGKEAAAPAEPTPPKKEGE
jgi:hypothetical protein